MTTHHLSQAVSLLNQGHSAQALALLEPLQRTLANSSDYWQLLALAYKGEGRLFEAEQAFHKSIELSEQPHVLTNLANFYRQRKDYNRALEFYDRALVLQPTNLSAQISRGHCLRDLKNYAAAERAFVDVLTAAPSNINAQLGLAQVFQQLGRQEQALDLFNRILSEHPEHVAALNGLGISLKVLGYLNDAVDSLMLAARLAPSSSEIISNLASALALADREEEAVVAYQRAIELDPNNLELHEWYNGYLGVIAHPEYLSSFRQVLARRPTDAAFSTALARKLLLNDQCDAALMVLTQARPGTDDLATILRETSHVQRESGQFDDAVDAAREAMAIAPERPDLRLELATAIMASGRDYAEALHLLDRLVNDLPYEQSFLAHYATALRYNQRMTEHDWLINSEQLINVRYVDTPPAFGSRREFVTYLKDQLKLLHTTRCHPVEQSMVSGTQTLDDLLSRQDPAINYLRAALFEQLQEIVAAMPEDQSHPFLKRKTASLAFSDSWSVLLQAHGYHKNHYHSAGWLSSAFYLVVPESVNHGEREGWIKFGEPGFRAREPLEPVYWVKPEEGALVVFPSYLWHGTVPLTTATERMTVGYDILPL